MEAIVAIVLVPTVIFLVLVAPLWVILHYASKRKLTKQLSESEQVELEHLLEHSRSMAERITTLEAILDEHKPNWRTRVKEQES